MSDQAQLGGVLGIDTHKLTHVAAIVDGLGRMQGTFAFAATDDGLRPLGYDQNSGLTRIEPDLWVDWKVVSHSPSADVRRRPARLLSLALTSGL